MGAHAVRVRRTEEANMDQLTLFDIDPGFGDGTGGRPCDYRFKRSIGQKVRIMIGPFADQNFKTGVITKIEPYFTKVLTAGGREYAGTPYSLSPVE